MSGFSLFVQNKIVVVFEWQLMAIRLFPLTFSRGDEAWWLYLHASHWQQFISVEIRLLFGFNAVQPYFNVPAEVVFAFLDFLHCRLPPVPARLFVIHGVSNFEVLPPFVVFCREHADGCKFEAPFVDASVHALSVVEELDIERRSISYFADSPPAPAHAFAVVVGFQGVDNVTDLELIDELQVLTNFLLGGLHRLR